MAKKDEQEQQPEEMPAPDPMIAAAENIIASLAQGGTYGSMEPQAQVFGAVGGMQPTGMISGGPVPVGGSTKGPGMTQGGMMYDPTTGQYTSSTAIQDLVTEEQKP